jgi:hypothetical protein
MLLAGRARLSLLSCLRSDPRQLLFWIVVSVLLLADGLISPL